MTNTEYEGKPEWETYSIQQKQFLKNKLSNLIDYGVDVRSVNKDYK